jgi:hypothetical protein
MDRMSIPMLGAGASLSVAVAGRSLMHYRLAGMA